MNDKPTLHPVRRFHQRAEAKIAQDYEDIKREHAGDSNVRGYNGENVWEALLRQWLPPQLQFAKRVRILATDETAPIQRTPEADLVIVDPRYPRALLDQGEVLSSAVIAAIECKSNLNITQFKDYCSKIEAMKTVGHQKSGDLKKLALEDLNGPFPFFCVAFSAIWADPVKFLVDRISNMQNEVPHPIFLPNGVFIASAGWCKSSATPLHASEECIKDTDGKVIFLEDGSPKTRPTPRQILSSVSGSPNGPIANLVRLLNARLVERGLASDDVVNSLWNLTPGDSQGFGRHWPIDLSRATDSYLESTKGRLG